MMTAPRLFLLFTACAAINACSLFFDTDALRQTGATGGNTGNGGGPGGGGAGAGLPGGAGGNGGFGGAGNASNVGCDDPDYCGPGSSCEPDGFCSVVSAEAPEDVLGVAFIRGSSEGQNVGHVAVHSSSGFASADRLSVWPLGFDQGDGSLPAIAQIDDPGVGFLATGGVDHVYYFGQGQSCDVDASEDSCINVCSINDTGVDCSPPRVLTGGARVNGAVIVPNNEPSQDRLYFVEDQDVSNERLQRVNRDCLETNQQDCPAELAGLYDAPDELNPLGLDLDPTEGSLWWNTWGGAGFDNACVYRFDPSADPFPAECEPTTPVINNPNRLAVSGAGVFVGTFDPDGAEGPIQRISRCTLASGPHPVTEFSSVTWPADADSDFLYATVLGSPDALQVLNASTGEIITSLFGVDGLPIVAVDASNPDYLLFGADKRVYRWRKPPSPCSTQGPAQCGNGCVEDGEACDDANDNPNDGCDACACALP